MPSGPRASLAILSFFHAIILGAAAAILPWAKLTPFAVLAGIVAIGHLTTAALALVGSERRLASWRLTSQASLVFIAYMAYAAIGSGLYCVALYEGVGFAILAAGIAAFLVAVLFTVPLAAWGLAATGGLFPKSRRRGVPNATHAALLVLLVAAFSAAEVGHSARGERRGSERDEDVDRAAFAALEGAAVTGRTGTLPQLFVTAPTTCDRSPRELEGVTAFVTLLRRLPGGKIGVQLSCVQRDDLEGALRAARERIEEDRVAGSALVDVVTRARALPDAGPLLGTVLVRPGIEGVCDGARCLTSWQLFGLDAFTEATAVAALSIEIGLTPEALRKHLGSPKTGFAGLDALTMRTYSVSATGEITPLRHLRGGKRPLEPATLDAAMRDAVAFASASQVSDGRFRYLVDPFNGKVRFDGFSIPRQAGTTLVLCEGASYGPRTKDVARKSLAFLASLEQRHDAASGIVFPKGAKRHAPLGNTALSEIAFLGCRGIVGHDFDATIRRSMAGLLSMQRADGAFEPAWDPQGGVPIQGKDALYAGGQAVLAMVLYEQQTDLEQPAGLREAIDRAMAYYAGPYWNMPIRDFFYLEENWHCLAARAALSSHRNDAYERFCVDYMTMKARFIEGADSGIDEDQIGAYGFGHLFPPHHAATSGYGEALASLIEVKRARGMDTAEDERRMAENLTYLLRHQWRADNCDVCTRNVRVVGGFSENVASPAIRIDFVQHAMSAYLTGGEALGLLPAREARRDGA